ncbi:MAG: CDP-alcohol phosphatidyltransferase family protein [Clostridia bacterium]|nr:CDP-alcohol phosphatidyltransferase family protein [Clostridia bacterium]
MKNIKMSDLKTIPNLLTLLRIIIIVPMIIAFISDNYIIVAVLMILSALSDLFDGKIARKFNQITDLGKILDPIADKLTLISFVVCATIKIPDLLIFVIIMVSKELLMLLGGFVLIKKNLPVPQAEWYGKIATAVFYCCVILYVIIFIFAKSVPLPVFITLISLTLLSMLYAFARYALLFINLIKNNNLKNKIDNNK